VSSAKGCWSVKYFVLLMDCIVRYICIDIPSKNMSTLEKTLSRKIYVNILSN
jgi:hypothetical protein